MRRKNFSGRKRIRRKGALERLNEQIKTLEKEKLQSKTPDLVDRKLRPKYKEKEILETRI